MIEQLKEPPQLEGIMFSMILSGILVQPSLQRRFSSLWFGGICLCSGLASVFQFC